jgi:uncharacterized protein (TIGR03382 family)
VIAHTGHWISDVLTLAPVALAVLALLLTRR